MFGPPTDQAHARSGFSLLEVVISIAILMTLTVAVAAMMRSGFDIRQGLSDKGRTIHRLTVSIEKVANDIQDALLVTTKDGDRNGIDRTVKTIFKLEKSGLGGDKLTLTTMTHQPRVANSYESELTLVEYVLKDSKEAPGRHDLYRAETPVIPLDLKEEPPTRLMAKDIKSFVVECWTGDRWSKDTWDTTRGDTRNLLPNMVRVTIEAFTHSRFEGDGQDVTQADEGTEKISTVIYPARAANFPEMKEPDKNIHWSGM